MTETSTTDQIDGRRIMYLYLATGLAVASLLILAGLGMRMAQAGWLAIDPSFFYALMTLHGIGMIAALVLCGMGGLWYLTRREVTMSVSLAYWAYGLAVAGVVLILLATLIGRFATAWTFLYPLPFENPTWPSWATGAYFIGVFLVTTGFTLWCVQIFEAVVRRYGGMRGAFGWDLVMHPKAFKESGRDTPPPQMVAAAVTSFNGMIAAAASMLLGVPLIVKWLDPAINLDPLWAKNVTYFFGHELANLIIYMLVALVYVGLPNYTGRKWKTNAVFVVGWWGTMTLILINYSHHLYMDFVQPGVLNYIGQGASYLSAVPVAVVTVYGGVLLIWGSGTRWALSTIFIYAGLVGWILGGAGALLDATIPFNSVFHNTLWVPAHFHGYLLGASFLFPIGWLFLLAERRGGGQTSEAKRWVISLTVFGGIVLVLAAFYLAGAAGVPRRYAVQPEPGALYAGLGAIGAMVLIVGLIFTGLEIRRLWTASAPAPSPEPATRAGLAEGRS